MKLRSKAAGKSGKAKRRKATTPKPKPKQPSRSNVAPRRRATTPAKEAEIARLTVELAKARNQLIETLEQQTAMSDVLRVVSSSQPSVQPVLEVVVASAARLCDAENATIHLREGDALVPRAQSGSLSFRTPLGERIPIDRNWVTGRAVLEVRTIHVPDLLSNDEYPEGTRVAERLGHRATLVVPLQQDKTAIGAILLRRAEPRPFSDRQIALIESFASQIVIAIENTRLLNELRQSLEQQAATADVLRVISSSPGDLNPVFDAILESATRICEARFAALWGYAEDKFRMLSSQNVPSELVEFGRQPRVWGPGTALGRIARDKQTVHVADALADSKSANNDVGRQMSIKFGVRTLLAVPMIKDGELIGAINIYRSEAQSFTDKQIELVTNFAAQAVIAVENTRLLSELRESLEQQTATSEVLGVISSSPGELVPVFQVMLENAARICEAKSGTMAIREGDAFRLVAFHNTSPELVEERLAQPMIRPGPGHHLSRLIQTKQMVHIPDLSTDPEAAPTLAKYAGARTALSVPMFKDNDVIGAFGIYRQEVRPFSDKQIELVKNFAAQAVIAIENARLLNELRQRTEDLTESLEQQTATAEVLRVISTSPNELSPVFQTLLANATRLCGANFGILNLYEEAAFPVVAMFNVPAAFSELRTRDPSVRPGSNHPLSRVAASKQVLQIIDYRVDEEYLKGEPIFVRFTEITATRTMIVVPMLRERELLGTISIYRTEVRAFSEKQIELVKNFAAQAVIAIENTRLLNELRQRTDDLSKSLQDLRTAQDRLIQTEKLASLGQLTAGIAHEIKNPLNFVNNFSGLSVELIDERGGPTS